MGGDSRCPDGLAREICRNVYGVRKIGRQLRREGFTVARCTVGRLMNAPGLLNARRLRGAIRDQGVRMTGADKSRALSARPRQPGLPCPGAEPPVGVGLHLCLDLERLRLLGRRIMREDRSVRAPSSGLRTLA